MNHTVNFLVKYFPHIPRSPRFHSFHFCFRRSARSSRLAFLTTVPISDFCHSGPSAGTVTISTGAVVASLGVSTLDKLGEFTRRYLRRQSGQCFNLQHGTGMQVPVVRTKRCARVARARVVEIGIDVEGLVSESRFLVVPALDGLLPSAIEECCGVVTCGLLIQEFDAATVGCIWVEERGARVLSCMRRVVGVVGRRGEILLKRVARSPPSTIEGGHSRLAVVIHAGNLALQGAGKGVRGTSETATTRTETPTAMSSGTGGVVWASILAWKESAENESHEPCSHASKFVVDLHVEHPPCPIYDCRRPWPPGSQDVPLGRLTFCRRVLLRRLDRRKGRGSARPLGCAALRRSFRAGLLPCKLSTLLGMTDPVSLP